MMEVKFGFANTYDIGDKIFQLNNVDPFEAAVIASRLESIDYPSNEFAIAEFLGLVNGADVIVIVGDLDADGLCATKIAYEYLKRAGYNVKYLISESASDRGLSREIVGDLMFTRLVDKVNPNVLIITVDCGINSRNAVETAQAVGLDVIITDHHNPVADLVPDCLIFNPKYDGHYEELSGSAVIYAIMSRIFGHSDELIQYAAIGTMTDMVPVLGTNRLLIRSGVEKIISNPAPVVESIIANAGINFASETDIAFYLGPIFNSAHRMGKLHVATSAIMEENETAISQLVELNSLRKLASSAVSMDDIADAVEEYDACVILTLDNESVQVGPLAANLMNTYLRAAMVITCAGNECKGSIRSPGVIESSKFVSANKDIIIEGGGHDAAAGFSCRADNVEEIKRRFVSYTQKKLDEHGDESLLEIKTPDFEIESSDIETACEIIHELRPYGSAFRMPLILLSDLTIKSLAVLKGKHTKISFVEFDYPGMYFFKVLPTDTFVPGTKVDIACEIVYNTFAGNTRPQLLIRDVVLL